MSAFGWFRPVLPNNDWLIYCGEQIIICTQDPYSTPSVRTNLRFLLFCNHFDFKNVFWENSPQLSKLSLNILTISGQPIG
jgi:hypothetical protein